MIPVFVPSYHRPEAIFLKRSILYAFPLYVFVREEDKESYKYLKQRPDTHLITLKKVKNIGETRRAMIQYAIHRGFDRVFMFDDDISRIDLSVWDEDRGCVRASGTIKGSPENWTKVLKFWEKHWGEEALIGAAYRPFSWSMKKEQLNSVCDQQLQQCVGIDVKQLQDAGLNYRSSEEVGNEDLFLQLECYMAGLSVGRLNSVQYDCAAMGSGSGGCNDSEPGAIQQKQEYRVKKFLAACKDHSLVRVSTTRSGVKSIKFNWKNLRELPNR